MFIILTYQKLPEEMARFRDPARNSFAAGNQELDADWWSIENLNRFACFGEIDALVRLGQATLHGCLFWMSQRARCLIELGQATARRVGSVL
jgi:hypothetical protein